MRCAPVWRGRVIWLPRIGLSSIEICACLGGRTWKTYWISTGSVGGIGSGAKVSSGLAVGAGAGAGAGCAGAGASSGRGALRQERDDSADGGGADQGGDDER